jgi:hypothetical protein
MLLVADILLPGYHSSTLFLWLNENHTYNSGVVNNRTQVTSAIISCILSHLNHKTIEEAKTLCTRKIIELQKQRRPVIEIV